MKQTDDIHFNPSNAFCVITLLIILMIALMGMMSCSTHRHATAVEQGTHTDTVYIATQQYDSIYIYNDKTLDRTKDTVYLREYSTEYRYKLLHDTLRIIERDSIPYPVNVTKERETKKPLSRLAELAGVLFISVISALALWVALRNKT